MTTFHSNGSRSPWGPLSVLAHRAHFLARSQFPGHVVLLRSQQPSNDLAAPRNSGLRRCPWLRVGCSSAGGTAGSHLRVQQLEVRAALLRFMRGVGMHRGASLLTQRWHLQPSAHRTSGLPSPCPWAPAPSACTAQALPAAIKSPAKPASEAEGSRLPANQTAWWGNGKERWKMGTPLVWDVGKRSCWLRQQSLPQRLQDMDLDVFQCCIWRMWSCTSGVCLGC